MPAQEGGQRIPPDEKAMNRDELEEDLTTKEMSALRRTERADKASRVIRDGIVGEAFEAVRQEIFEAIQRASMETNVDGLRRSLHLIDKVQGLLEHWIKDGKLAQHDIDYLAQEREKLGLMGKLRTFRRPA